MKKNVLFVFLTAALFCGTLFLGCASVPKETLDEKDAVIKNLNTDIDSLKQEISRLNDSNAALTRTNDELAQKLEAAEAAQKKAAEKKAEPKIK